MYKQLFNHMNLLFENWRKFLLEQRKINVNSLESAVQLLMDNPNQEILIDKPKGSTKKFGGETPWTLPFHYGEYSHIINPADGMGWDLAIIPSAQEGDDSLIPDDPLIPVGCAKYSEDQGKKIGNDKIIVAPNGFVTEDDKKEMEQFFALVGFFDPVEWYK